MKALQKAGKPAPEEMPVPGPEEPQKPELEDRLAAAGVAFFAGAPTALIAWLLALAAAKSFHLALPHYYYWFLGIWALLVISGFLLPRSMHEIFSSFWNWLLLGIGVLIALLMGAS